MAPGGDTNIIEHFQCIVHEQLQRASRTVSGVQSYFNERLQECQRQLDMKQLLRPVVRGLRHRPLAAVSLDDSSNKSNPKGPRDYTPEEREEALRELEQMTPEEREALRQAVWAQMLKSHKVMVEEEEGKPPKEVDLLTLMDQVMEEKARRDYGVDQWKKRDEPIALRLKEELTSVDVNPGDPKRMVLPEEEHELELTLQRMGNGICWSTFPIPWLGKMLGKRDFAFALFAKPDVVKETMEEQWAGLDPDMVLSSEDYYHHIVCHAPKTELTVMVIPSKDLPLDKTVQRFEQRLRDSLVQLENGGPLPDDVEEELKKIRTTFSEPMLRTSGLINKGRLREGANFFFTCGTDEQLAVEAITPGLVKDQEHVYLGVFFNPKVTFAFYDMFMGEQALDPKAKKQVGNNMLYFANGFNLDHNSDNRHQMLVEEGEEWPTPKFEELTLRPSQFAYVPDNSNNLLKGLKGKPRPLARIEAYTTVLGEEDGIALHTK